VRRRWSLAGQLLALQLVIVAIVVLVVAAVGFADSIATFRQVEGRRMLAVAESTAAQELVRQEVREGRTQSLAIVADRAADFSGATYVLIATADRRVLASSEDPARVNRQLSVEDTTRPDDRVWVGDTTASGQDAVAARVPVLSDEPGRVGELLGVVLVGKAYPSFTEQFRSAVPGLLVYVGLASALGIAGSLLVARRVKRQTLGLEPREIRRLVEHREAMLTGIKEGVIGLDDQERITLVNAEAHRLLGLPPDCIGTTPDELGVDPRLAAVLTGRVVGRDQVVLVGERILTLNRVPIAVRDRPVGSVTTMRDLTDLTTLRRELGVSRQATEALRAQAHEFANRLHTVSGLIELGEYDEVKRYVERLTRTTQRIMTAVTQRIGDPPLAALLVAKASLAAERGIELRIADAARLDPVDEQLSADLTTVVGNLVDNALDAVGASGEGWVDGGWIEVAVGEDDGEVTVTVRDSGPGVAPELVDEVFERGFTTKAARNGERGFGLALTRSICLRRGGTVGVHNAGGAVFAARLPRKTGVRA
jgi:sensor histidine kinase regulating citrate/malate metabolism